MVKNGSQIFLAADTSTPLGSVAVLAQDSRDRHARLLGEVSWDRQQSHSEIIAQQTQDLLENLKLSFADLAGFACGIGPGSFTGIRVALNFIKTLAYTFNKPVHVMNSLQLLALPALQKNPKVFCMQSAFRDLAYVAQYQSGKLENSELLQPSAWTMDQFNKFDQEIGLVVGEAYTSFKNEVSPGQSLKISVDVRLENRPRSSNFQFYDFIHTPNSQILQWFQVKALYVRASEAEEKLWKGGSISSDRQRDEIS